MKSVLLKPDGSINWKFILLLILSSFLLTWSTIASDWQSFISFSYDNRPILQRVLQVLIGEFSWFVLLVIWAWLGYKKPILLNRLGNVILTAGLATIVNIILRKVLFSAIDPKPFGFGETRDYLVETAFIVEIIFLFVLIDFFSIRFNNKLFAYFFFLAVTFVVFSPVFNLIFDQSIFSITIALDSFSRQAVTGMIAAVLMRGFGVAFLTKQSQTSELRHAILDKMRSGQQKPEIWNELELANPDMPKRKLARIFTTVSQHPDDLKEIKLSQACLVVYSVLTCIPLVSSVNVFQQIYSLDYSFGSRFFQELIQVSMLGILLVKLYLLYELLYHRAFVYRLTFVISLIVGGLLVIASVRLGWIYLVGGIINLIAAWVAYHIATYVYPNYRLLYKPGADYADRL